MLIETPYKEGDTISLKLASGEEIVARLDKEEQDVLVLTKPLVLIAQGEGLGLAPFMFSVSPDSKFNMRLSAVSCIVKTEGEIAKQYTAQTTGIQMV
jgi:hypothetical protein